MPLQFDSFIIFFFDNESGRYFLLVITPHLNQHDEHRAHNDLIFFPIVNHIGAATIIKRPSNQLQYNKGRTIHHLFYLPSSNQ